MFESNAKDYKYERNCWNEVDSTMDPKDLKSCRNRKRETKSNTTTLMNYVVSFINPISNTSGQFEVISRYVLCSQHDNFERPSRILPDSQVLLDPNEMQGPTGKPTINTELIQSWPKTFLLQRKLKLWGL